jgi:hypothetical protein
VTLEGKVKIFMHSEKLTPRGRRYASTEDVIARIRAELARTGEVWLKRLRVQREVEESLAAKAGVSVEQFRVGMALSMLKARSARKRARGVVR